MTYRIVEKSKIRSPNVKNVKKLKLFKTTEISMYTI